MSPVSRFERGPIFLAVFCKSGTARRRLFCFSVESSRSPPPPPPPLPLAFVESSLVSCTSFSLNFFLSGFFLWASTTSGSICSRSTTPEPDVNDSGCTHLHTHLLG